MDDTNYEISELSYREFVLKSKAYQIQNFVNTLTEIHLSIIKDPENYRKNKQEMEEEIKYLTDHITHYCTTM
jgi:hypothetical protein